MGVRPDGRANRLWEPQEIPDPEKWMERYFEHNMQILDEPISILANPTFLPAAIADKYDSLWTEERMRKLIAKAVARGVALEIQAESSFPRPKFLRLAKEMGAKFSFGTNNFDARPKDLSRWLEAIVWLDLGPNDIWSNEKK
jgi:histidinol phosphatase-like PHP family hydrolase